MNYTEVNNTIVPQLPHYLDANLATYVILCMIVLIVVGTLLFGAIRKTNPLYMMGRWLYLKVSLCCCKKRTAQRVQEDSKELADLLKDIEKTTGSAV